MSRRRHLRAVLGLCYLLTVGLLIATSVATYRKALPWQRAAHVELHTQQVGLGLRSHADVKFQGLLVGEVRTVSTTGTVATVELAIDRDLIDQIPADVDAMVVPKTLFGDKYVDLRAGSVVDADRLGDGDTIRQTRRAVELGEIFDRLVPVLQTLQPARVSAVLSGLADALDGRGADIARSLRTTQAVLHRLSPSYDDLVADVRLLASTADVYSSAAPDLLRALDATTSITRDNLVPHEDDLAALLDSVTGTASTAQQVLETNRDGLVRLTGRAQPVLSLLRTYSGEVPCVLAALEAGNKLANLASGVRGPYIALSVDMIVDQPAYSYPDDLPDNPRSEAHLDNLPAEVPGWEPHCPVLPDRVTALGPTPPPYSGQPYAQTFRADRESGNDAATTPPAPGTPTREVLARALAAGEMGVDVRDVPGYATLLVLPLTHGQVTVR